MDHELVKKFWQEYRIQTQDDETGFPFANPSDAARSLVKAYNWVGVITEYLMTIMETITKAELEVSKNSLDTAKLERLILALNPPPHWATKNNNMLKAFIWSKASQEDLNLLRKLELAEDLAQAEWDRAKKEYEVYSTMLRTLDKSTELMIQYINWC